MDVDDASLERLTPAALDPADRSGRETLELHLARYEFAAESARGGRTFDAACGAGFGSRLLKERGPQDTNVLGLDISKDAIRHATEHYGGPGVRFEVADAMTYRDPEGFDTIVSLETIEHLDDPSGFVSVLAGLLRPAGILVASVPVTPSVDINPHHRHDFTEGSFRTLFEPHGLVEVDRLHQVQPIHLLRLLRREETRIKGMRRNLPSWYLSHPRAALRRAGSLFRHGFTNHYLTIAWRAPS